MSKVFAVLGLFLILACSVQLHAQSPRPLPRNNPKVVFDPTNPAFPSLGRPDAPIAIVEFSEFGCPYCRRHASTVLPRLLEKYVNAGDVRYFFVQVPPEGEDGARIGAIALLCAAEADAMLPMYQRLFEGGGMDRTKAGAAAAAVGLEAGSFARCEGAADARSRLQTHLEAARRNSVIGTPTFFIGRIRKDRLVDVRMTFGIKPVDYFESVVDQLLKNGS